MLNNKLAWPNVDPNYWEKKLSGLILTRTTQIRKNDGNVKRNTRRFSLVTSPFLPPKKNSLSSEKTIKSIRLNELFCRLLSPGGKIAVYDALNFQWTGASIKRERRESNVSINERQPHASIGADFLFDIPALPPPSRRSLVRITSDSISCHITYRISGFRLVKLFARLAAKI